MIRGQKTKGKKDQKSQSMESQLKRALADYHNLERRVEEERRLLTALSSAILIEKLLPVLDNLENAQTHLGDEGLNMVLKQFKSVLATEGVEEINPQGGQFDPHLHEAIETVQGDTDNQVIRVQAKGYKIADKILRPAKVVVSRTKIDKNVEEKAEKAQEFGDYA